MTKKRTSIFSNINSKKHVKLLVIFIWMSFTLHLYALWGLSVASDIAMKNNPPAQNQQKIHNIILETKTESPLEPKEAVISDKNNISKAPVQDKTKPEEYNVANFNPALAQGVGGDSSYIPQEEVKAEEETKKESTKDTDVGIEIQKDAEKVKQKAAAGGGETAPTLYDIKKKPVINLYSTGTASLATKSKDYAQYFLRMQKKIEKYHKEFFPVYQYYQGLLKDGEVVVEYTLDQSGDILEAKVVSSYGSDIVDNASLNSIVYAKNFGKLPKDLQEEKEIKIRFHFIYLSR